ncbi:GMC family oxidoreductase N-terminal domain-containing protein [Gemmobacter lanyuensis]
MTTSSWGGAAGCVLAARLTEDPGTQVLLLESGGSDRRLTIAMPAAIPFVYQNKALGWNEMAGPEPYLAGQMIDEKRGRVLGGSTSVNAMIFNRGNARDFDGWAAQGLSGWGGRMCCRISVGWKTLPKGQAPRGAATGH